MRPIKLTISAFGPYADLTVVELDKLGKNGLYLITGDTGAGKTTIFDAIAYALYGAASGAIRDPKLFRSKYAQSDTPTFVELVFEYDNKEYTVKRNPEYERAAKRGSGLTTEKADGQLTLPDGKVITKVKDINSKIQEILGIDFSQFSQIAMIAQGEFLKLIHATTEERQGIFRKIFKTDYFQQLQVSLKNESLDLKKQYDALTNSVNQYINGVITKEDDVLTIELNKAKAKEIPISQTVLLIEEIINQDTTAKTKLETELAEFEKELSVIATKIGKGEEIEKTKLALENAKSAIETKKQLQQQTAQHLAQQKERAPESEKLSNSMAVIKSQLPKYQELANLEKSVLQKQTALQQNQNTSIETTATISKLEEKISTSKKELLVLKNAPILLAELTLKKNTLAEQKLALDEVLKELKTLQLVEMRFNSTKSSYIELSNTAQELKILYNQQYKAYLDEQAGVLAQQLKTGEKCPVCGSLEHLEPATLTDTAPTKAQLEESKSKSEAAESKATKQSELAAKQGGEVTSKKDFIQKLGAKILGDCVFEEIETLIATKNSQLLNEQAENLKAIATAEEQAKRNAQLNKDIPILEEELKEKNTLLSQLGASIASLTAEIKAISESNESLKKDLSFKDIKEAENNLSEIEKNIALIKNQLESAEKDHQMAISQVQELQGKINGFQEQLKACQNIDLPTLKEKSQQLQASKDSTTIILGEINSRLDRNNSALQNIKLQFFNLNQVENQLSWVKSLSDTANGNVSGKEKIMLETYIQMTYFDRIIARANTRLMIMSGGQYELKRKKIAAEHRSQSGLDLDVIDHYNGTERSIKSISGGESFKASLALAFGLSDEIQASAGGIRLDTMFIDEGFGSLDEESLNQAITALVGLSDQNRLIGIISHVNELKERIDKKLLVKKAPAGGSFITIEA